MIAADVIQHIRLVILGIVCGAVLGLLFDIYRVLRGCLHPGKLFTTLGDLLFWVFGTSVVGLLLFSQNWVEMRFYIAICIMAGLFIYRKIASRSVVGIMVFFSRLLAKAMSAFVRSAFLPLRWAGMTGTVACYRIEKWVRGPAGRVKTGIPKILSWPVRGIYEIAKKLIS